MKVMNSFLCIGPEIEACVILLTSVERKALDDGLRVAAKYQSERGRLEVYRSVFGVACHAAVPCWSDQAMAAIAKGYVGNDQKRVRGFAACILTGTPYGGPERWWEQRGDDNGGGKAKLEPPQPVKPRPGGAAAKLVYEKGNGKSPSKSKSVKKVPARSRVPVLSR